MTSTFFAGSVRAVPSERDAYLLGRSASPKSFAALDDDGRRAFVRGLFDRHGAINAPGAAAPRCAVRASVELLRAVRDFVAVPAVEARGRLEWTGNNALELLSRLYDGATVFSAAKRARYVAWSTWVPGLSGRSSGWETQFRWSRVLPEAAPPKKQHVTDSGYDLTLVAKAHAHGKVQFYRTGVRVQPAYGWYFDLVPRSSIAKTGYLVANSIGIIDRTYVGEILVPLLKVDDAAPELPLPARIVQIIPRPIVHVELVESVDLHETKRGAGGFGSTG